MKTRHLQFNVLTRRSASAAAGSATFDATTGSVRTGGGDGAVGLPDSAAPAQERRRSARGAWRRIARVFRRYSSWTRIGWRQPLRDRVTRLTQHQPALQAHAELVERTFLAIGGSLQEQSRLAAQVAEQGKRLSSFTATTAEANPVRAAILSIEQTLAALDRFHHETVGLIDGLRVQHDEIARLGSSGAQLERAIAPLRIVETLFRIESAGLEPEIQAAFSALTHDIARLDGRVRETFLGHFDAMRTTRQEIAAVLDQLALQRGDQEQVAAAQRAAIRRSLATLETEIARIRDGDERTIAAVTALESEANAIVVALQFQDITRQKLEHVQSAMAVLSERANGSDPGTAIAYIEHAARLEAAQLEGVETDLAEARGTIASGLRRIAGHLARIEHECANESAGGAAEQVTAIVRMLEETFAMLQRLNTRAAENAAAAVRAVRSFRGITADLADTILELTWSIRLIALNAQVQAAQVQRCDGLEILARQTYLISEDTSRHAERFGADLVALAKTLRQLVERAESFAGETREVAAQLERVSGATISGLEAQREIVVDAMGRFGPLVRKTRALSADLERRAALAAVDCTPLHAAAMDLRELSDWCAARATHEGIAAIRPELSALKSRYTMASERTVHRTVVDRTERATATPPEETPSPAVKAVATASAADSLGANVELF